MKTWTIETPLNEKEDASTRLMRQRLASLCLLAIIFVALAAADVRAETVNCTAITTLPYTISTPGSYCLTGHLSTSITTGNAITINASNVVLDLNGFALSFDALSDEGTGETVANGIYALNQNNITIRNGMIRGFKRGIFLEQQTPSGLSASSRGHVIEDIRAHRNRQEGITVTGTGIIVRNNHVFETSTFIGQASAHGIAVTGPGNRVLYNDVIATGTGLQGGSSSIGIILEGDNCVIEGNRVSGPGGPDTKGMKVGGAVVAVVNNRVTGMQIGMYFFSGFCVIKDNLVAASTPYIGGWDGGGNYPQP